MLIVLLLYTAVLPDAEFSFMELKYRAGLHTGVSSFSSVTVTVREAVSVFPAPSATWIVREYEVVPPS